MSECVGSLVNRVYPMYTKKVAGPGQCNVKMGQFSEVMTWRLTGSAGHGRPVLDQNPLGSLHHRGLLHVHRAGTQTHTVVISWNDFSDVVAVYSVWKEETYLILIIHTWPI